MRTFLRPALACAVTASTAIAAAPAKHQIRLTRPIETGHVVKLTAAGAMNVSMVADGREIFSLNLDVAFESTAEVEEVDATGRAVRVAHTVTKCVMTLDGETTELFPKGAIVMAKRGDEATQFSHWSRKLDSMEQEALELVAGLEYETATDDQMFGTAAPAAVGGSWAISPQAMSKVFWEHGKMRIPAERITGESTLVELTDQAGLPCEVINTRWKVDNAFIFPGLVPPGVTVEKSIVTANVYMLVPEDLGRPRLGDAQTYEIDAVFQSDDPELTGGEGSARLTAVITAQHEYEHQRRQASVSTRHGR